MIFKETNIPDSYLIELEKFEDERGFFSRLYCSSDFKNIGINKNIKQINNSYSELIGTLRGIHFQSKPKSESKIVRCIKGSLFDVIVDLRKNSKTYKRWFGAILSSENRKMMYVPEGFGHGFLTLENRTEAIYFVSESFSPEYEKTLLWNDKEIGIKWPIKPRVISDKDKNNPNFDESFHFS